MDIEALVRNMMIVEPGERIGKPFIIDTEDVDMMTTVQTDPSEGHIRWMDEQMDIEGVEDAKEVDCARAGQQHDDGALCGVLRIWSRLWPVAAWSPLKRSLVGKWTR